MRAGRSSFPKWCGPARYAAWLLPLPVLFACHAGHRPATVPGAALVGEEPVPAVYLYENHSASLIAWRRAGVSDRILVHIDGHIDFDWLPDDAVARIAAARPDELPNLELHPYALNGDVYRRFGIWDFIYPAARMGVVRELVWVVPDGTLADAASVAQLARQRILGKIQMVSLREAAALRREGRVLRGTLLGLPVTICELRDLPDLPEPVLLDIDLDYFTTRSAISQVVTAAPWISPDKVLDALHQHGVRTDLATISMSTIGGFLPPSCRWLAEVVRDRLRAPHAEISVPKELVRAGSLKSAGGPARAVEICKRWVKARPDDATAWFLLYRALKAARRNDESMQARERAVHLDPLLEHEELFEADRLWRNRRYEAALALYGGYLERLPSSPFRAYALRRKASCLVGLGREDEAVATYWKVLELAPNHADTHMDLGVLLRRRGMIPQSLDEFRMARSILPDRADYAMALGTTSLMAGRVADGIANLSDAVQRRPCWADARNNLAVALLEAGRYQEAAKQLDAGLTLEPPTPRMREIANRLRRRGVAIGGVKRISFE